MNIIDYFPNIVFEPIEHRYHVEDEEFTSISSVLEQYSKPFEREKIAKRVAQRDGVSPQEIKLQWDIRRDLSIVRGTEFHLYVETYLNERRKIDIHTPIEAEVAQFHSFWDGRCDAIYEVLATELIVYDKEWKLAGTIDCLIKNQESGKIYLIDWKTNKEIKKENRFQRFLAPIDHLEECDMIKYSLQTSFYRAILEKNTSIEIDSVNLVHFPKGKDYQILKCLDLRKEVSEVIANFCEK